MRAIRPILALAAGLLVFPLHADVTRVTINGGTLVMEHIPPVPARLKAELNR